MVHADNRGKYGTHGKPMVASGPLLIFTLILDAVAAAECPIQAFATKSR